MSDNLSFPVFSVFLHNIIPAFLHFSLCIISLSSPDQKFLHTTDLNHLTCLNSVNFRDFLNLPALSFILPR